MVKYMNEKNSTKARNQKTKKRHIKIPKDFYKPLKWSVPYKKQYEAYLKIKTGKEKQGKDKRSAKKVMGNSKTNSKKEVPTHLLHLRSDGSGWLKYADGTRAMAKGVSWSIFKIRSTVFTDPVCEVQLIFKRNGSGSLHKNAKRNRPRSNAKIAGRQKSIGEGNRSLRQTN